MFRRVRPTRAILDPLSRAAGSDIYVRSERELRAAVGEIRRGGRPGRIVIADDIKITSGVDLDSSMPPTEITSSGGAVVYATGSYAFGVGCSDCTVSGLTIRGADDSSYASKGISLNQTALIRNLRIVGCRIFATECVKDEDAAGLQFAEISGCTFECDDGSNYPALHITGSYHIVGGNSIYCVGGTAATNVCISAYNCTLCSFASNRLVDGSIEIDGSTSNACSRNTFVGNVTQYGIREINNGGFRNAYVGNICASITTNLGNADNVIVGNAGSVSVTAQAGDLYQTATDSDPLNT